MGLPGEYNDTDANFTIHSSHVATTKLVVVNDTKIELTATSAQCELAIAQ